MLKTVRDLSWRKFCKRWNESQGAIMGEEIMGAERGLLGSPLLLPFWSPATRIRPTAIGDWEGCNMLYCRYNLAGA